MVDGTTLPMTEIALATGFRSIRRFNDAFLKRFRKSPSALRRCGEPIPGGNVTWRIAYRPPFAAEHLFGFLSRRTLGGVETGDAGSYARVIRLGRRISHFTARHLADQHALEFATPATNVGDLLEITRRVRCLFDLDADPLAIASQWKADPILGPELKKLPGIRVPGCWSGFELAVRAIVGQQVSVAGARTVTTRLVEKFGDSVSIPGQPALTHAFPTPAALARAVGGDWGMPEARADAIRGLARAVQAGKLELEADADPREVRERLMALPGIGPWTAEYIAMRALRDPDAFPFSDLVVKREMKKLGTAIDLAAWRPWRAYATLYLWNRST
jgi:AraC family transcriptional regulator of adaptative response / DNA-3-methyladenine glycosylase II